MRLKIVFNFVEKIPHFKYIHNVLSLAPTICLYFIFSTKKNIYMYMLKFFNTKIIYGMFHCMKF